MGDKDNTGFIIGHVGKYFHELLQTLVNWDENLRINTDKDLLFLLGLGINSSSFSFDVEFGGCLWSGNEDVSGTVYAYCPDVETDFGSDEWGCSGCLDKTEKRALRNKVFLSLPKILCERIR